MKTANTWEQLALVLLLPTCVLVKMSHGHGMNLYLYHLPVNDTLLLEFLENP